MLCAAMALVTSSKLVNILRSARVAVRGEGLEEEERGEEAKEEEEGGQKAEVLPVTVQAAGASMCMCLYMYMCVCVCVCVCVHAIEMVYTGHEAEWTTLLW